MTMQASRLALSAPPGIDEWGREAIGRIEAGSRRSADTHLVPLPLPAFAASARPAEQA